VLCFIICVWVDYQYMSLYTSTYTAWTISNRVMNKNKNHQLMHKKYIIFIRRKPPTCFDAAESSSGRRVSLHKGSTYTVEWECTIDFALRWEGSVNSPRSGYETVLPDDDPAGSKHVGGFLRMKITYFLCISWWLLFLYDIVHGYGNIKKGKLTFRFA
jgi:hypothetical protein